MTYAAVGPDEAIILAPGDGVIPRAGSAEVLLQENEGLVTEVGPGVNAECLHLAGRNRTDAMELADRQLLDEAGPHLWRDDKLPVWLTIV